MDRNRVWTIGSVLSMAVIVTAGLLIGVQPQLAAAAAADADRATIAATNAEHEKVLLRLTEDFKDVDALRAQSFGLARSVPTGTQMPEFVTQVDALTGATQVTLTGITVANPVAYTPVVGADATLAGVPPVTNAKITAQNFAAMTVTISIRAGYGQVLDFVNGLQTGTRLFLVSGLSTHDAEEPGMVEATISGLVYALVPPGTVIPPTELDAQAATETTAAG